MSFRNAAKTSAAAAAMLAAIAVSGAAFAQDAGAGPSVSVNFGAATDYVFRGVSQTNEKAQAFAGVDLAYDMFYAGAWTSNVDFSNAGDTSTTQEVDLYAGVKPTLGPIALDVGALYYGYLNQPKGSPVDYWEFYAKGSHAVGPVTVGAAVYWSPEFTGKTGDGWYYEGNLAYAATDKLSFSGALGRQDIQAGGSYTTWNLGAGYAFTDNIALDVRYWDTDIGGLDAAKGRVVATLKASF